MAERVIGPYTIVRELGRGGMGVVYLARDTRLDRDVAIKSLPEHLAQDHDRLARFEREAKTLAQLNHPNIAGIYALEEHEGKKYLVMEYVEGDTLAARLAGSAVAVDEALDFAMQIAAGVEAAHEAGVIHRDLKPGNVIVTPDGRAKVLDFGLARVDEPSSSSTDAMEADSPTLTSPARHSPTTPGVILGTAAYMSPEQARGRKVDKRSDIWSFGVILYEMLTGTNPLVGETVSDSLGAVLHKQIDLDRLPPRTPPVVWHLLSRCLERDKTQRYRDIGDVRLEIQSATKDPVHLLPGVVREDSSGRWTGGKAMAVVALVALVACVSAFATWVLRAPASRPRPIVRKLQIHVDGLRRDDGFSPVISPDGTKIVYAAHGSLWVRALADLDPIELAGTRGASLPFWSPGSNEIGFHDNSRLWRMPAIGGARTMICVTPRVLEAVAGAAWMPDGRVLFTTAWGGPFWEVPVTGGEPRQVFQTDPHVKDFHFASPLPDGSGVLSVRHRAQGNADTIVLVRNGSFEVLLEHRNEDLVAPEYANGYIVYGRVQSTGTIWAVPFSLESHKISGQPFLVVESAELASVSRDGTLAYTASTSVGTGQLVWVDRTGAVKEVVGEPQQGLSWPVVSPDGQHVAAMATETGMSEIWIYDLARHTRRPLTTKRGAAYVTGWVSNTRLVYSEEGRTYARSISESGPAEQLVDSDSTTITPDEHYMAVERRVDNSLDIVVYDLPAHSEARPFLATQAVEEEPAFRPTGGWLAYASDETGRDEVYLTAFPDGGRRWQVSTGGGTMPQWNYRGDQLTFSTDRADSADLMAVEVTTEPQLQIGEPKLLFNGADSDINLDKGWSVSPDGQRILGVRDVLPEFARNQIIIVENWFAEFENKR